MEAVDELSNHRDLAMLICDVNMPRMNGLDVLERMKMDGRGNVPVLMLTTEGQPQLIQRAKQSGAKGWIVKPFKPDLLLAAVRKLVGAE
jgi:two-component system chemotaxis response regulator CheY